MAIDPLLQQILEERAAQGRLSDRSLNAARDAGIFNVFNSGDFVNRPASISRVDADGFTITPVTPSRELPPVQSSVQANSYEGLVNRGGEIVDTETGHAFSSPQELAQFLGVLPHQLDFSQIPEENIAPDISNLVADAMTSLQEQGFQLNPNVELTPERMAEFLKIAESEINPFFQSQFSIARESLLREAGYNVESIQAFENDLERQYGASVRQLGESAAERGFAQSGIRQRDERDLATDTQLAIDENRRAAQFNAGTQARSFAEQFGGLLGNEIPQSPTLGEAPRVLAGEGQFQQSSRDLPFFELSDSVLNGIIGTQEFNRRGAISQRTSELESAQRTIEANPLPRQI